MADKLAYQLVIRTRLTRGDRCRVRTEHYSHIDDATCIMRGLLESVCRVESRFYSVSVSLRQYGGVVARASAVRLQA